jgi:sec-independent protein translocase protein TatB
MPGFGDSIFIFVLALLLFGPKKLPELARQLGKLMGDFRRASNEFRSQMEEELRISEQADRQKQIAAIEAAAPATPALDAPAETLPEPEHPHQQPPEPSFVSASDDAPEPTHEPNHEPDPEPAPLPIATSGDLSLMPPATGLPVANTSLAPFVDSIPEVSSDTSHTPQHDPALETESLHG